MGRSPGVQVAGAVIYKQTKGAILYAHLGQRSWEPQVWVLGEGTRYVSLLKDGEEGIQLSEKPNAHRAPAPFLSQPRF